MIRYFKKHTSKQIGACLGMSESRLDWLLHRFSYATHSTGRAREYKVWTDDNHPVYLEDRVPAFQKIDYIHLNPVRQGIVALPEHYLFSSAGQYAGLREGLVPVTVLER